MPTEFCAHLDFTTFLNSAGQEGSCKSYRQSQVLFSQGEPADAVFYIQNGKVTLTVVSEQGKEAVIAILAAGDFFGEGCLQGQALRTATASAMTDCLILRMGKPAMLRMLHELPAFAETFISYLLSRKNRVEEDLLDQLFNTAEKRLARLLVLLANFNTDGETQTVLPKISQATLAEMVGTTRSRVSYFMKRFRTLGFVEYDGDLKVHSSLLDLVLHD